MADPVIVFSGAQGLNTKIDPARLSINEDGRCYLTRALNVDISNSMRVSRRNGYRKISENPGHSIFYEEGPCLFVSGNYLSRLNSDFSVTHLAMLDRPDYRMRFAQVPSSGDIYFGNSQDKGVYREGSVDIWTADYTELQDDLNALEALRSDYLSGSIDFIDYSNTVEEILRDTETFYNNPLPPRHLEFYRGRMFIAYDKFVLFSHPWQYNMFNHSDNYIPFDSAVIMLRRTADGLYVGTESKVYFLSGTGPDEFSVTVISDDPPVEHTDTRVQADDVIEDVRGEVVFWTAKKTGVCFGGPGGQYKNFTKNLVQLPNSLEGTALIKDNKYLSLIKA